METHRSDELLHLGAGSGLFLVQLSVIIPGLLPTLGLLGVITVVALLPMLVVGLAASLVLAPPLGLWRLATRGRRRRRQHAAEAARAHLTSHTGPAASRLGQIRGAGSAAFGARGMGQGEPSFLETVEDESHRHRAVSRQDRERLSQLR
jgi:hypothetical protein